MWCITLPLVHSFIISASFLKAKEDITDNWWDYPEVFITLAYMLIEMIMHHTVDPGRLNLEHQVHHALVISGISYIVIYDCAAIALLHSALFCEISSFFLELHNIGQQQKTWSVGQTMMVDVAFVATFFYTRPYQFTLLLLYGSWWQHSMITVTLILLFYMLNLYWTCRITCMVYKRLWLNHRNVEYVAMGTKQ